MPQHTPPRTASQHRGPISRGTTAYSRKRAVAACQVCRARRTKCDQKRPSCSFCVKTGAECVFETSSQATFDQASLSIIDRLDRLESKIDALPRTLGSASQGRSSPPVLQQQNCSLQPDNQGRQEQLDTTSTPAGILPENLDSVLQWPVFRNISHLEDGHTPTASSLITDCYDTPASAHIPSLSGDELDPTSCSLWVDQFLAHVHVKNPILDQLEVRRIVRRLSLQGAGWDAESCLALLVCANGALARPLNQSLSIDDPATQTALALFAAAQKRLGPNLVSAGLVQAQCAFFSGVLLMSLVRPMDAWTMFAHALAVCQIMEHRHQLGQTTCNVLDYSETRSDRQQSLMWSCWKSEREVRFELGLPRQCGATEDPPGLFPTPPENCGDDEARAWYFYLSEISLWRLDNETRQQMLKLSELAGAQRESALEQVGQETLERIRAWHESLPNNLSMGTPANSSSFPQDDYDASDNILGFVLYGRITLVHELISWWPLTALSSSNVDPTSPSALPAQIDKALEFHHNRLRVNSPGFYHRHHGTWLMMRSSARSACILVAFSYLYPDQQCAIPEGWKDLVHATIAMLKYWSLESNDMHGATIVLESLMTRCA